MQAAVLFRETFGRAPTEAASAPGRVEFIGNHTDYNGGLVLGAAIDRRVEVALAPRADARVRLYSPARPVVEADLSAISPLEGAAAWANYPLGVLAVMQEEGLRTPHGFDLAVASTIPEGAGLSSSAALELATACVLAAHYRARIRKNELVRLCRRAENQFVGVPCGMLDQAVSAFGARDHLVLVDSRTERIECIAMPPQTGFWIFNSHRAHALAGSLYAQRHTECMEALAGLARYYPRAKHLTALRPAQVERYREDLTEEHFRRALHVTSENARVREMTRLLQSGDLQEAGRLLYASHESSRRLFENSTEELDFLVNELAQTPHVYGARLTGGGFGGAVLAWTSDRFGGEHAQVIARAYETAFGQQPSILPCQTDDGAGRMENGNG